MQIYVRYHHHGWGQIFIGKKTFYFSKNCKKLFTMRWQSKTMKICCLIHPSEGKRECVYYNNDTHIHIPIPAKQQWRHSTFILFPLVVSSWISKYKSHSELESSCTYNSYNYISSSHNADSFNDVGNNNVGLQSLWKLLNIFLNISTFYEESTGSYKGFPSQGHWLKDP